MEAGKRRDTATSKDTSTSKWRATNILVAPKWNLDKHHLHLMGIEGLAECKASVSNLRRIQVKDIFEEVEDYLKTYSSAGWISAEEQVELKLFSKTRLGRKLNNMLWQDKRLFKLKPVPNPLMSGTIPPIPPPLGINTGNTGSPNRVDTMPTTNDTINIMTTTNVAQNVVDENLLQLLDLRGGSHVTHVPEFDKEDFMSCKVRFLVFLDGLKPYLLKTLEDGSFVPLLNLTFTRLKCLLNDLENNGVIIPQAEVNATFVNNLPRKWLSMNQTHWANNSIKNDCLATLYGKYNYEEGLIDQIYESKTQRFTIQASSSKALISNNQFQDSDLDVKEDLRSSSEFIANLNAEYHKKALLANQKRFYKSSGRVGSARKPMDKSNEINFACGKEGHF
ncbi:hypothetical protein Tco_0757763 [Tanacetum coccineum]